MEWLLRHEVPDVAVGCHTGVVDDRQFASAEVPLRVDDTLHVLHLDSNPQVRLVAAHLEGAGLHVRVREGANSLSSPFRRVWLTATIRCIGCSATSTARRIPTSGICAIKVVSFVLN